MMMLMMMMIFVFVFVFIFTATATFSIHAHSLQLLAPIVVVFAVLCFCCACFVPLLVLAAPKVHSNRSNAKLKWLLNQSQSSKMSKTTPEADGIRETTETTETRAEAELF